MSLLALSGTNSVTGGYEIDNSLKLEQPERITRGYSAISQKTSSDRKRTTLSYWVKRTQLNASGNGIVFIMYAGNTIMLGFENDKLRVSSSYGYSLISNALFRDTSAWYNLVFSIDTTQATANDRVKAYVNGTEVTSWSTQTITISQNANNGMFNEVNGDHYFGWSDSQATGCYVAEAHCIDGQALTASDFGEYDDDSGIWIPKEYTGTYGNQGYYLDFKNASNLGQDQSGNSNNFGTFYAGGSENQATDSPTNNFCTLFPPPDAVTGTEPSVKEGGTTMFGGVSNTQNAFGTMGVRSGKWYFESTITNSGGVGTENHNFGVIDPEQITYVMTSGRDIGASPAGWACASNSLPRNNNASAANANATGALAENEIMGVAIDMDNGKIWWHRQGTWTSINSTVGNPANGTTPAFSNLLTATDNFVIPASGFYVNNGNQVRVMNFGGYAQAVFTAVGTYADANGYGSFAYQPPSGYYALCTKNLAEYG